MAQSSSKKEVEIEVADLRDQFNIFELVGPKASQVIHGALTPVENEERDDLKKVCVPLDLVRFDLTPVVLGSTGSTSDSRVCSPGNGHWYQST